MKQRTTDRYNLQRFVDAQDDCNVIGTAFSELHAGRKTGHWIWYIFPQVEGLGQSELSKYFAISSLAEAKAYLAHPILSPRLRECSRLVNMIEGRAIGEILGHDDIKFKSSMTLFANATQKNVVFLEALQKYYSGEFDPLTTKWLENRKRRSKR